MVLVVDQHPRRYRQPVGHRVQADERANHQGLDRYSLEGRVHRYFPVVVALYQPLEAVERQHHQQEVEVPVPRQQEAEPHLEPEEVQAVHSNWKQLVHVDGEQLVELNEIES